MATAQKTAVVAQVRKDVQAATAVVMTEYRGLTVQQIGELRNKLRDAGARYVVAKNTLIRIAMKEEGHEVPDETLSGPTALAYIGEDIASAAKALRAFAKTNDNLVIKGALLDGQFMGAEDAEKLADLESAEELLASFAGMFESMLGYAPHMADDLLTETAGLMEALEAKKPA
ncbi:50S ribosomal protein L10 [Stomatohabitans albus]|uniref:50S ribosomal protein L10 n=1 Tax=Stomatohabitans albus TaxID=3110766 RepID=UPI00300D478C